MRCDIIIPVWNQPAVTKRCVESIFEHTDYPFRLILIDNGSEDQTKNYLQEMCEREKEKIFLIRNSVNLGFVKAINQAIAASDAPYLCIMNNDTVATSGWLSEMIYVMESNPEIGLLNPSSNTSGQMPLQGEGIDEYSKRLKCFHGTIQELFTCRGFCMIVRRSVIDRLGLLDEIYHFGYYDDTDYCKRAQQHGFRTARAKAAYVHHMENTSFKTLHNNNELFDRNEKVFFGRWGRPVRIAYFVDAMRSASRIDAIAVRIARSGHQMNIFLRMGLPWPVTLDHFDIRRFDINPFTYFAVSAYKVLKRKKKKKLDILITDNVAFGHVLKAMRDLHRSEVLICPGADAIHCLAEEISKRV